MLTMNLNENIKIKKGKYTPYILFWSRTWHMDTKCNCKRDGLWVRFPLEEMVSRQSAVHCSVWYLIRFYLITIRPGRKRKLGTVIYYYYILVTTCALFSLTKKNFTLHPAYNNIGRRKYVPGSLCLVLRQFVAINTLPFPSDTDLKKNTLNSSKKTIPAWLIQQYH